MCKFVIYLVPTDVHANVIADITKRVERFERKPLPYDDNYNYVEFLRFQCHCGSMVSSRYDDGNDVTFNEPFNNDEYEDYKKTKAFITGVLNHTDHMKIYSYWSDVDEQRLKKHKMTVCLSDLSIDILAELPYNTCLIINK